MTKFFKCLNTVYKLDNYSILIRTDITHKQALIERLKCLNILLLYKALHTKRYYKLCIRNDIVGFRTLQCPRYQMGDILQPFTDYFTKFPKCKCKSVICKS